MASSLIWRQTFLLCSGDTGMALLVSSTAASFTGFTVTSSEKHLLFTNFIIYCLFFLLHYLIRILINKIIHLYLSLICDSVPTYMRQIKYRKPFSSLTDPQLISSLLQWRTFTLILLLHNFSLCILIWFKCDQYFHSHLHPYTKKNLLFTTHNKKIIPLTSSSAIPLAINDSPTTLVHFFCSLPLLVRST